MAHAPSSDLHVELRHEAGDLVDAGALGPVAGVSMNVVVHPVVGHARLNEPGQIRSVVPGEVGVPIGQAVRMRSMVGGVTRNAVQASLPMAADGYGYRCRRLSIPEPA